MALIKTSAQTYEQQVKKNNVCDLLTSGHGKEGDLVKCLNEKATLADSQACVVLAISGRDRLQERIENEKAGKTL